MRRHIVGLGICCVAGLAAASLPAYADPLNPFPLQVMTEADKNELLKAIVASLESGDTSKTYTWSNKATVAGTSPNRTNARWKVKPAPQSAGKNCREVRINLNTAAQEEYVHPIFCKQEGGWQMVSKK
jgi:hypothetical protein